MKRAAAALVIVLAGWSADAAALDVRPLVSSESWHLFAVEYARSDDVRVSRLVRGGRGRVDMSWYFFVAVGHGRVVLIDCGTDALSRRGALRERWNIARAVSVTEALARVGIAPGDVTDVVVTHPHWDHVGALSRFPDAAVHRRADGELFAGFRAREAGRHTAHQVFVELDCTGRTVVVAGDAAYLYRNIEDARPVTVTVDAEQNVADVQAAVREVGADDVLPGHDPALFERYRSDTEGVAAICR